MRIVHVITRLIVGGAQENTVDTVLGLRRLFGADVTLISGPTTGPEGSLEDRFLEHPGVLNRARHLVRPIHPWHDALAIFELTRKLKIQRAEVVHTHSGKAGILGRLSARRAGAALVVHGIHGPSFGPFQSPLSNTVFRTAESQAAKWTDHFVTVADAMSRQYMAAGIGAPQQFTCIRSGFDLAPFQNTRRDPERLKSLGWPEDAVVVGVVARLFKLKGHDELLDAAPTLIREHPQLRFLFIGDGLFRSRLEERVRQSGLMGHVHFTGLVRPESVPGWVGCMDLLAHLSRREGLARALSQAAAAGKPTVAYNCDGAGEVCIDGQTGFLIEPGDQSGLLRHLGALAGDSALRERLGRAGAALARSEFDVRTMVERTWELYLRLYSKPH